MTSATHDDERIKVYGDAAIVTGRTTGELLVEGKEQPPFIRYTHVYVKQGGKDRESMWAASFRGTVSVAGPSTRSLGSIE